MTSDLFAVDRGSIEVKRKLTEPFEVSVKNKNHGAPILILFFHLNERRASILEETDLCLTPRQLRFQLSAEIGEIHWISTTTVVTRSIRAFRRPDEFLPPPVVASMNCSSTFRSRSRVVKRAVAMEMAVTVFDPFLTPTAIVALGASPVSRLDDALPHADVVTLHCPRTPDTLGLIDARRLAMLKPSALIINTARGGLIDEPALYLALKSGKLAGAGLDVLAQEPPPADHPLFQLSHVIFAPHMAGVTVEALDRMSIAAVENILSVFDGRPIVANCVNREVLRAE